MMNMIHKASRLITEGFDQKGIKYGNRIEETERETSFVEAGFSIDNGPFVRVRFISSDEDNDVAVRAFGIINVTEGKRKQVSDAINDANTKYRYIKFVLDDDGAVFDVRLAVVVMVKIYLVLEHCIQQSPYRQLLLAERFAFDVGDFLQFVGRD